MSQWIPPASTMAKVQDDKNRVEAAGVHASQGLKRGLTVLAPISEPGSFSNHRFEEGSLSSSEAELSRLEAVPRATLAAQLTCQGFS